MIRPLTPLVMTLVLAGWSLASEPLTVHVIGSAPKATSKEGVAQLKEKSDAAFKSYTDLQDALKKQYGKKLEGWPPAEQERLQAARDAFKEAQIDWFYSSGLSQKDIDDSVREVGEALRKKSVGVVASPEEADLLIQVVGRAKVMTDELANPNSTIKNVAAEVVLRVTPGGRTDVSALAASGAVWSERKSFWMHANTETVHVLSVEAPYWILIARKPGSALIASYKGAAGQAADALVKFSADNADRLSGARKKTE